MCSSDLYRGTKLLQKTFEDRKLKSEPGKNVIKHTIKLHDCYMRLFNANMVPYDALMTVVDSLVCSSTPAFDVWAATKRIAISQFLKENTGKTQCSLSLILDAPTISSICDQADEEYQSLLESSLWVATNLKEDRDAASRAFLLEKLTARVITLKSTKVLAGPVEKMGTNCLTVRPKQNPFTLPTLHQRKLQIKRSLPRANLPDLNGSRQSQ